MAESVTLVRRLPGTSHVHQEDRHLVLVHGKVDPNRLADALSALWETRLRADLAGG